jgi:dihydrolipoamide dehydrogenase
MPELVTDIAIIGGGPAGYSAAVRASKLGARVTLMEKGEMGGACLNWACIPTKTLLHSLEVLRLIKNADILGVNVGTTSLDMMKLRSRKESVISLLKSGIEQLMADNSVEVIHGEARLRSPHEIEVSQNDGTLRSLRADRVIVASGSIPRRLNVPGADSAGVIYSRELLDLARVPQSLIMVGGGVVGVEMASIFNELGCKVTILELLSGILSGEDIELTRILERALKKDGIQILTGAQITRIDIASGMKQVHFEQTGTSEKLEAESVCVATGQKPCLEGLEMAECGIASSERGIEVNEHMRTNLPHIFAAGDVTGKGMLAYVATAQGRVAAENTMGIESVMDYSAVPHCVFTSPELASVGLTEAQALAQGLKIKCLRSNMAANASAAIASERRGLVKIIVAKDTEQILGAHILGRDASNLIAECALAIKLHATIADLANTLHPHPSFSEAIQEAALNDQVEPI